jgi:hypothetical protein
MSSLSIFKTRLPLLLEFVGFRIALAAAFAFACLVFAPAQAGWQPYEYLVTIETAEFPRQLQYSGCPLRPLNKAFIKCAKANGDDQYNYENLWFCQGKAFGLERLASWAVPSGSSIGIKITHRTVNPSVYEALAAAEAILRIYVDARLNSVSVPTVTVPDETYNDIIVALENEHFYPIVTRLEVPVQISAGIFMRDQSGRHVLNLCYAPGSYGS